MDVTESYILSDSTSGNGTRRTFQDAAARDRNMPKPACLTHAYPVGTGHLDLAGFGCARAKHSGYRIRSR